MERSSINQPVQVPAPTRRQTLASVVATRLSTPLQYVQGPALPSLWIVGSGCPPWTVEMATLPRDPGASLSSTRTWLPLNQAV